MEIHTAAIANTDVNVERISSVIRSPLGRDSETTIWIQNENGELLTGATSQKFITEVVQY